MFKDGALRAVTVTGETMAVDKDGNVSNTVHVTDGQKYWEVDVSDYFLSSEKFENGEPCDTYSTCACNLIGNFNEKITILVLQDDGIVKDCELHIKRVSVEFCNQNIWYCKWSSDNPYDEDKCFPYKEYDRALTWVDYNKVEADGSVERIKGGSVQVMLDDDQKELVAKLKSALKELKENNVFLTMDYNQNLFAFNTRNFDVEKDLEDLSNEYKEIDWRNDKFVVAKIDEDLLSEYGEDYGFYCKPKGQ